MEKRKHRELQMYTHGSWIEGKTIIIRRAEAYSRGSTRKYERKIKFNRSDGLYFLLDNKKYFEYEFEPCE